MDEPYTCIVLGCKNLVTFDNESKCYYLQQQETPEKASSPMANLFSLLRRYEMRRYTFGQAVLDLFLVCITGGFWLVYLILKYLRTH